MRAEIIEITETEIGDIVAPEVGTCETDLIDIKIVIIEIIEINIVKCHQANQNYCPCF